MGEEGVGHLQRHLGAAMDGQLQTGRAQGGGVVEAIAHHGRAPCGHMAGLVLGGHAAQGALDAQRLGQPGDDAGVVAAEVIRI
ncbi:MAG: hypothetical protein R3F60_04200 [bacterium]